MCSSDLALSHKENGVSVLAFRLSFLNRAAKIIVLHISYVKTDKVVSSADIGALDPHFMFES